MLLREAATCGRREACGMKAIRRIGATTLLVSGAVAAATFTSVGGAGAAAPTNGCSASSQLLSVAELTAEGYHVPALVDSPTSGILSYGKPGNGDGWVCGHQIGRKLTSFGDPLYGFTDNQLPASS